MYNARSTQSQVPVQAKPTINPQTIETTTRTIITNSHVISISNNQEHLEWTVKSD